MVPVRSCLGMSSSNFGSIGVEAMDREDDKRTLAQSMRSTLLWTVQRSSGSDVEFLESQRIIQQLPSLDGEDEHKLEYIKTLMMLASDDMKHVTVYITVAFATTALLLGGSLTEQIFSAATWVRTVLTLGLFALALGSLAFFRYVRKLHLTRMQLARCLPSVDTIRARELWAGKAGVGAIHLRAYNLGLYLLTAGLTAEGIVFVVTLLQTGD
jgi:hypothetical protein